MALNKRQSNLLGRFADMKPHDEWRIKYTGTSRECLRELAQMGFISEAPTTSRWSKTYRITDAGLAALNLPPLPPPTPTLDRIAELHDKSQAIGEFLSWLDTQGIALGKYNAFDALIPVGRSHDHLLHAFFGIDSDAEENERRAMMAYVQAQGQDEARK